MAGEKDSTGAHDDLSKLVWAGIGLFLLWAAWNWGRAYIIYPIYLVKWAEIRLYDMLVGVGPVGHETLEKIQLYLTGQYPLHDMRGSNFYRSIDRVGHVMRYPFAVIFAGLALLIALRMKGERNKKSLDFKGLMAYQARYWRTLTTNSAFDPDNATKNMRPALRPLQWMEENKISLDVTDNILAFDEREKADKAFGKQLGRSWRGAKGAQTYVRALSVVFAVHYESKDIAVPGREKKMKTAYWLLEELDVLYSTTKDKKERDDKIEALIAPYLNNEKIMKPFEEEAGNHAYTAPALMRALKWARESGGVLASAQFTWLKEIDRSLWYPLNNVGRRAFHTEASGAISHYFYEISNRKPMHEPHMEKALMGLEDYLKLQGLQG
jgi:intracellular multiplication protein IcmP